MRFISWWKDNELRAWKTINSGAKHFTALISTLFILLFFVVLSLFRSDKTKWHKSATIGMSVFGWLVKHDKHRHQFVYHLSRCHVTLFTLGFSVRKEVLELFCILHLLDILSYKHTVCLVSPSHFLYLCQRYFSHTNLIIF